jgi:hypothetical protein
MFHRVLTHIVLSRLGLSVLLLAENGGIGDHARDRNRMTGTITELEGVALDLPVAAFSA